MKLRNKIVAYVAMLVFVLSFIPSLAQSCDCKKNNDQESSNVQHSKKNHKHTALRHRHKQVALNTKTPTFQAKQLNEPPQTFTITQ